MLARQYGISQLSGRVEETSCTDVFVEGLVTEADAAALAKQDAGSRESLQFEMEGIEQRLR